MKRRTLLILISALLVACGGSPPQAEQRRAQPYRVLSTAIDQANAALMISIQVDPPVTEETVKTAAEIAIRDNKARFQTITVRSFTSPQPDGLAYCTSIYSNGSITHQVDPRAESKKIPTH